MHRGVCSECRGEGLRCVADAGKRCEWLEREGWRGDGKFCKLRISLGAWREGRVGFEVVVVEIVGLMLRESRIQAMMGLTEGKSKVHLRHFVR